MEIENQIILNIPEYEEKVLGNCENCNCTLYDVEEPIKVGYELFCDDYCFKEAYGFKELYPTEVEGKRCCNCNEVLTNEYEGYIDDYTDTYCSEECFKEYQGYYE